MEENKSPVQAVLMTKEKVHVQINAAAAKKGLTISTLQKRRLELVINDDADNLKAMAAFIADAKTVKDLAAEVHEIGKRPSLLEGRAWDAGKKLVFEEVEALLDFTAKYDGFLAAAAAKKRQQEAEKARKETISKGIEANIMTFSNMLISANTIKELLAVEARINLEKSPSMAKKYGEYHSLAIERIDIVLLPILKDQKRLLQEREALNTELLKAEADNDPDKMDELLAQVDGKSNEILQNHSLIQEAALTQEFFPVETATEVLPEFKVKRTNYSFEIIDLAIVLKKAPDLLEFSINKEKAKEVLEKLKKDGAFNDVDEIVVNGIKYIATRVREAL